MTSKVMIVPFFGQLPEWFDRWKRNTERLKEHGYDFLFDEDEDDFRARVKRVLGIACPSMWNTGNIWDFRPAFGVLYEEEIRGFDFWGHCDFDQVFGRVEQWYTDELLSSNDILANHFDYISGPWTLYRNCPNVNNLFRRSGSWQERMTSASPSGWAEKEFTDVVDAAHEQGLIRRRYDYWQTKDLNDFSTLTLHDDGRLMEGNTEVAIAHFRRKKEWPKGC